MEAGKMDSEESGNRDNDGLSGGCDFMQEFMNLEEFFDASTINNVTSPDTKVNIFLSQNTPGEDTAMAANEIESQRLQHMDESCDPMPHINDLVQRNVTSSIADDNTKFTTDTSDCHSLLENGVMRDQRYWDRRVKNNIAAKRSRDAKRLKETTVVKRWTLLEEENKRLKEQILDMQKRLKAATEEVK